MGHQGAWLIKGGDVDDEGMPTTTTTTATRGTTSRATSSMRKEDNACAKKAVHYHITPANTLITIETHNKEKRERELLASTW